MHAKWEKLCIMSFGWQVLAQQVFKRRVCLIAATTGGQGLLQDLVYVLKLRRYVDSVLDLSSVQSSVLLTKECLDQERPGKAPCVILSNSLGLTNVSTVCQWAGDNQCILLYYTHWVTAVPRAVLNMIPCMLWIMGYHVNVPFVADVSPVVQHFMRQKRDALLYNGAILCDSVDDVCVTLLLYGRRVRLGELLVRVQQRFRRRRHCAIILQRVSKRWLYEPEQRLGRRVVERLR